MVFRFNSHFALILLHDSNACRYSLAKSTLVFEKNRIAVIKMVEGLEERNNNRAQIRKRSAYLFSKR